MEKRFFLTAFSIDRRDFLKFIFVIDVSLTISDEGIDILSRAVLSHADLLPENGDCAITSGSPSSLGSF